MPIDSFFRTLAEDRRNRAIGVVLSGSGADGTEGLRAIKAEGGFAIVQEPDSAQFRGMPESAIAAGVVDFRGTPERIAGELARLGSHPYVVVPAVSQVRRPRRCPIKSSASTRSSSRCAGSRGSTSAATSARPFFGASNGAWRCAASAAWSM